MDTGMVQVTANPARREEGTAMREQIRDWLLEEAWSVRQDEVPDTEWALRVESGRQVLLNVRQRSGHSDQALIFGAVQLDKDVQDRLSALSAEERREFLWDVRFRLLGIGVEFEGLTEVPERVVVVPAIYRDALTKDTFFRRLSQVHSATIAVLWMIARKFAQPPPEHTFGLEAPK